MVTLIIVKSFQALVMKDLENVERFLVAIVGFQLDDFRMKLLKDFGCEIGEGAVEDRGQRCIGKLSLVSQKLLVPLHDVRKLRLD